MHLCAGTHGDLRRALNPMKLELFVGKKTPVQMFLPKDPSLHLPLFPYILIHTVLTLQLSGTKNKPPGIKFKSFSLFSTSPAEFPD